MATPGTITLTAKRDGLTPATIEIKSAPVEITAGLSTEMPQQLPGRWRKSAQPRHDPGHAAARGSKNSIALLNRASSSRLVYVCFTSDGRWARARGRGPEGQGRIQTACHSLAAVFACLGGVCNCSIGCIGYFFISVGLNR
jgi:hypothetical protein